MLIKILVKEFHHHWSNLRANNADLLSFCKVCWRQDCSDFTNILLCLFPFWLHLIYPMILWNNKLPRTGSTEGLDGFPRFRVASFSVFVIWIASSGDIKVISGSLGCFYVITLSSENGHVSNPKGDSWFSLHLIQDFHSSSQLFTPQGLRK